MIAVDTNLLIYAHREGCPEHQAAKSAIEAAADRRDGWGIPAPCLLEFWSVVTHPASAGGESSPAAAREFIQALVETAGAVILPPPAALGPRCLQIAEQLDVRGPRIFDVQIGLTALESGVTEIWTHDAGFVAFPGLKVCDPLDHPETQSLATGAPPASRGAVAPAGRPAVASPHGTKRQPDRRPGRRAGTAEVESSH